MPFLHICHHCGKHLSRKQNLDNHIARYHGGKCLESCQVGDDLAKIGPTKNASADVSETGGSSGSTSYVDPPERNGKNILGEKISNVDTSPKKKKSNWGISLKEYNKKLRLADKLPSVWEQGTGPDLLQVGGGLGEERDVFHDDSEGDDKHSESGESQESDREEEEDSSDENDSDAKDPHWVFNHFIYHAKQHLKKDGDGYDLKTLRKTFRKFYANGIKWIHALQKDSIHKKVVSLARDLRDSDFDYAESIDAAVAKRKFLLDRLVLKEDISDEEEDHDTNNTDFD